MKYLARMGWIVLCVLLACACALAEGGSISGCAYVDANENAVADSGEQLMTGVPVSLEKWTGSGWESCAQTATDAYGSYTFASLADGEYRVLCPLSGQDMYPASIGASQQYDGGVVCTQKITVSAGAAVSGADVGLRPAAYLRVYAFRDSDGNGEVGKYERDLQGVAVQVLQGDSVIASGTTSKKGVANLTVAPGQHVLRFTLPESYGFTMTGKDSSIGPAEGSAADTLPMTFTAGQTTEAGVGARPVGSLSGRAFEDMNNNGIMEDGEPGVAGVTVHLAGQRTGVKRTLVTDESGEYCFTSLPDDKYTISADLPEGMLYARYSKTGGDRRSIFTGSIMERDFSVKGAANVTDKNIGTVQKGVIYGHAFLDLNYNGSWEEGEPPFKGVTVEVIKLSNNESMGKTTTGEDGSFRIENLRGGDYRVRAILPEDGTIFTVTGIGAAHEVNLFAQREGRRENSIQPLTIVSGGEAQAIIGVARGASVSGTVFTDNDYNGRLNGKEKTLSGLKVRAIDANGSVAATATTGKKGGYTLTGLMPGQYTIEIQRKAGYGFTRLRPEENGGSHVTMLVGDYGVTAPITLAMDQHLTGVNGGMLPSATVSGSFFHDVNDNGLWDNGELGMLSGKVRLYSEDAEIDLTLVPGEDGSYFFDGVMPGTYTITYVLPEHCEMARTASGGNTVSHDGLQTVTSSFKVAMGDELVRPLAGAVTLGNFEGYVFRDSNANGVMDSGESGIAGAAVVLKGKGEHETVSGADGAFSLMGLRPANYTLTVTLPDGFIFSAPLSSEGLLFAPAASQQLPCPWQALINRNAKSIGAVQPASVSGRIWMDENQSGTYEDEWIMEGVALTLTSEQTGLEYAAVSSASGFRFDNVRPGSYTVAFTLPAQSTPANDASSTFAFTGAAMQQTGIVVTEGAQVSGLTTGLVSRTSIGGTAWLDENGSRFPVAGVNVTLYLNGAAQQTTVTGEDGSYRFDGLWPGQYSVTASLPQGMIFVRSDDPNYASGASVITNESNGVGSSDSFTLLMAQHQLSRDILFIKPAKIGDIAWLDENRNGLVDGGERSIPGVQVRLVQNGSVAYETVTDQYGYYLFNDVYPGQYTLEASAYPQLAPTQQVEALRIISSCLVEGDGNLARSESFSVLSGQSDKNFDLGYILLDGQTIPEAILAQPSGRDWTIPNTPKED